MLLARHQQPRLDIGAVILGDGRLKAAHGGECAGVGEPDANRQRAAERHAIDAGGGRPLEDRKLRANLRNEGAYEPAAVFLHRVFVGELDVGNARADDDDPAKRLAREVVVGECEGVIAHESFVVVDGERRMDDAAHGTKQRVVAWPTESAIARRLLGLAAPVQRHDHGIPGGFGPLRDEDRDAMGISEVPLHEAGRAFGDGKVEQRRRIVGAGDSRQGERRGDGSQELPSSDAQSCSPAHDNPGWRASHTGALGSCYAADRSEEIMAEKGLASRFKAAISKEGEKGQRAAEAEAQEAARRARFITAEKRLFDDLTALVAEIGGIDAVEGDGMMQFTRLDRKLALHRDSSATRLEVRFDGQGVGAALVEIGEAWHLENARRTVILFDEGLEELLVLGLGLPSPDRGEAMSEAAAVAADPATPLAAPPVQEPGEQVILRDVKLDKPAAAPTKKDGPKEQVILRDVQVDKPSGDAKRSDKNLGSPGSTIRDLPKW
jgi:hypothetical protein